MYEFLKNYICKIKQQTIWFIGVISLHLFLIMIYSVDVRYNNLGRCTAISQPVLAYTWGRLKVSSE